MEQIARHIPVQSLGIDAAVLELNCPPSKTAATRLDRCAWLAPAVLCFDRHGAAQRIQPKHRIGSRNQRDFGDRDAGDQIPAHHVSERLILPDSVHVDRDPLRRPEQRRSSIATIVQVRLEGIPLVLIDVHAAQTPVQKIGQRQSATCVDVALRGRLNPGWEFSAGELTPRKRCSRDHVDLGGRGTQQHGDRACDRRR
jgi:hypothetical protein